MENDKDVDSMLYLFVTSSLQTKNKWEIHIRKSVLNNGIWLKKEMRLKR